MKRRSGLSVLIATIASLAVATSALAAATITNGSFEDGAWTGGGNTYAKVSPGETTLNGWTVSVGSVDWIQGYWVSEDGARSVDMNGTAPGATAGAISQTLATTVNNTYVVQFWLAGNPDGGPAVKILYVSATGTAPQTYTFDTTGKTKGSVAGMGWVQQAYTFVATSASTVLTFAADTANQSNQGPALDNISVTETLATGANCKKDGWVTMHDSLGNPFKNQGDCVSYYATDGRNLAAG